MRTKIFTLFLALAASVGTMFASVTIDGIAYNLNDQELTAEVTSGGNYSGSIVIPESINYNAKVYSVTSIGSLAFNWASMTSIEIPNSVISIGEYAFCDCVILTSVTIPNSFISIGGYAFAGCTSLTSPIYNAHIFVFMPYSYSGEYTIPEGIESIASTAFDCCRGLTSVTIPNSVTSIGGGAFSFCTSLTSVIIPNSVTSIGGGAFSGCSGLTFIEIPNSVTSIGGEAFSGCSSLTSVTIGNSVTSIEYWAFYKCRSLTSIEIPNSVTSIGEDAFSGCESLTSVTIPNSVTSIGKDAFNACRGITSVVWNARNCASTQYYSQYYTPFYGISSQITSFTIGEEVESIPSYLCYGMSNLTAITIPTSVTSIGKYAFNGCSSLTDIYATCGDLERVKQMFNYDSRVKYKPLPYSITVNTENVNVLLPQNICEALVLTAVPDYGYHFVQWSDGNMENPRTIVVTQDTIIDVEFAPNKYTISVTCDSTQGYIDGVGEFDYLTDKTFEAIPNYGYHFTQWSDGNTDNPRTITIIQNTTFQAVFAKNTYFITKNAEHGTIEGNDSAEYLDEVTLIVNPDYGYHFAQWSDDNTDNPRTFVLTQDTTFTAELAINQYSISVTCDQVRGSIEGENGVFDYLTEKTYEVIPNYGYHFAQWSDGNTDNPRTITITQDISISAVLAKNTYTIIDNSDPTQGYIYVAGTYEYLDEIVLIPVNEYGYHFIQWSDGLTDSKQTIVLTKDTTFAAEFAIDKSGTCGANNMLNWEFDDQEKVLTISGSGRLDDNYTYGIEAPTQMKKLIIGDNISIIGNSAFYDCSRLMKIYFGRAIEIIGSNAFRKCPYILEIHAPMEFPPIIDESVFAECGNLGGIDCYVSEESLSLYKKTDVWSSFNLLVESSHEAIDNPSVDNHKTTKLIRDGQILILRGEKTYTVTGQEVK